MPIFLIFFEDLNVGAFWGSSRLERIVLADNNLRTIWRDTFRDQVELMLKTLGHLTYHELFKFTQGLIHLLDLSGNVLHSLDPVKY